MSRNQNTRVRTRSASELTSMAKPRLTAFAGLRRVYVSGRITKQEVEDYYAGAEFDTVPQVRMRQLPSLPKHWEIDEVPRSQSMPSSPITVSEKSTNDPPRVIKLDVEALFGFKKSSSSTAFRDTDLGRLLISGMSRSDNRAREL